MRSAFSFVGLLALLVWSPRAHATVGGPTVVEVLGYEATERRLYLLETHLDEGDQPPKLFQITFGKQGPGLLTQEKPPEGVDKRVEDLSKRLGKLPSISEQSFEMTGKVIGQALIATRGPVLQLVPRYDVQVRLVWKQGKASASAVTTVTPHGRPGVTLDRSLLVAAESCSVSILRYLGDPFEEGYSVDKPVVICLPPRRAPATGAAPPAK